MANGRLQSDPLFLGLTRPTLVFGVTYMWFVVNIMLNIIAFINTEDMQFLLVAFPVIHAIGFFISSKEPRFLDIEFIKSAKCSKCKNLAYHGFTHSYDLF